MKITSKKLGQYPWWEGTIEGYHFQAAVYDEPSEYGINEGRTSKLMVWDEAERRRTRTADTLPMRSARNLLRSTEKRGNSRPLP